MMTTITKSALDSGTYKDKLTNILDNSRMLHLSEREAAKLYGEVIAGLITLQRRVRGWIEERNQVKDHNKVVARTKWEFGSFRKPDKEADAFRVQQRHSHGWRAPLNRRYAQLGSSVNEPLGRTAGVHTALGRKRIEVADILSGVLSRQRHPAPKILAVDPVKQIRNHHIALAAPLP